MNEKAAKLARKMSGMMNVSMKSIKKEWKRLNWKEKTKYANMMKSVVSQVEKQ